MSRENLNNQAKQLLDSGQLSYLEYKLYLENVESKRPIGVMFIGFGDVTKSSLNFIADEIGRENNQFGTDISKIVIASHDMTEQKRNESTRIFNELEKIAPGIKYSHIEDYEIPHLIDDIDIVFIAASNSAGCKNREEMFDANLKVLVKYSKLLSGYKGVINIITNPPELLCYNFAKITNFDPRQISGNSHLDHMRVNQFLSRHFNLGRILHSTAYCIGFHGSSNDYSIGAWPLGFFTIKLRSGIQTVQLEELDQQRVADFVRREGPIQFEYMIKSGRRSTPTIESTGKAVALTLIAYTNGTIINCSTFYRGYYLLTPARFENSFCLPDFGLMKNITERDQKELDKSITTLYKQSGEIKFSHPLIVSSKQSEGVILQDIADKVNNQCIDEIESPLSPEMVDDLENIAAEINENEISRKKKRLKSIIYSPNQVSETGIPLEITSYTILNKGKYRLNRDILILPGGTLEINPGTMLSFGDSNGIYCYGRLIADAETALLDSFIIFNAIREGWGNITIAGNSASESRIENCEIRDSNGITKPLDPDRIIKELELSDNDRCYAGILVYDCNPALVNNRISNGTNGGLFLYKAGGSVRQNTIYQNRIESDLARTIFGENVVAVKDECLASQFIAGLIGNLNTIKNNSGDEVKIIR